MDFTRFANAGILGLVCFDFLIRDYGLYRAGVEKVLMVISISEACLAGLFGLISMAFR